jgi:integrase
MARPRKKELGVIPRKLADGRTVYDVRWRDEYGHNRSVTKYSLDEANEVASDIRYGRDNLDLIPEITLGEFFGLGDVQKTLRREHNLSQKTRAYWQQLWRKHVCHSEYGIAGKSLKQLSKAKAIDDFLNAMTEHGVGKPMQRRVLGIVSAIMDKAVEYERAQRNPIQTIKKKPDSGRQRDIYIPSIKTIELLRQELLDSPKRLTETKKELDALIVSLLAYEAPRPEELLDLSWSDSDLKAKSLTIYAPKAARGKSTVAERRAPINDVVAEDLQAWRDKQNGNAHSPIIALPGKAAWDEYAWRNWRKRTFKPALERVATRIAKNNRRQREQIESMRPYDLRHTALSLWLACGGKDENGEWDGSPANPVDVAAWGGHKVRTLWDNYAHVVENAEHVPIAQQIRDARAALGLS